MIYVNKIQVHYNLYIFKMCLVYFLFCSQNKHHFFINITNIAKSIYQLLHFQDQAN